MPENKSRVFSSGAGAPAAAARSRTTFPKISYWLVSDRSCWRRSFIARMCSCRRAVSEACASACCTRISCERLARRPWLPPVARATWPCWSMRSCRCSLPKAKRLREPEPPCTRMSRGFCERRCEVAGWFASDWLEEAAWAAELPSAVRSSCTRWRTPSRRQAASVCASSACVRWCARTSTSARALTASKARRRAAVSASAS
mmetsp:Transcript_16058/g.45436  ORF Transcript_16058/g.45436 Transcript_16058/m.45436 type:complete len:202 (-) Transcript_16058:205-810(-)